MATHVKAPDEVNAAVAFVDAGGTIQRATAPFIDRFAEHLGSQSGEVQSVVSGEVDHATVLLDGVEADISAVHARDGRRHALLTVPLDEPDPARGSANPLLELPLDSSAAIVWLKGLDGRYLRVNRAYSKHLGIEPEEVCGRMDSEIAPESIDGTRLRQLESVEHDPLELEYTVPAVGDRPAFSVLRFALRDAGGEPIAVCGVAAPRAQAQIARAECMRLMRIAGVGGLDQSTIREALLAEWGLTPAPPGHPMNGEPSVEMQPHVDPPPDEDGGPEAERERAERAGEEARSALARAQEELQRSAADAESAAAALVAERQRVEQLRSELAAVRDRLDSAQRSLAERPSREELEQQRARADRADAALGEERARAARAEASAQSALAQEQAREQAPAAPARRGGILSSLLRGAR